MNPLTVSAHYAAFVWFTSQKENTDKSRAEAMQYARTHWEKFLPLANPGWGKLLIKIARPRKKKVKALAGKQDNPEAPRVRRSPAPRALPPAPFSAN